MSRALDDLCPLLLPQAFELIARCAEHSVPLLVVDTLRTVAEQAINLSLGRSATANSKHIAATNSACPECHGTKSHAIDVAPYETFNLHGPDKVQWSVWLKDPSADLPPEARLACMKPEWQRIGLIAESLGLRWGGRWKKPVDPGHAELVLAT